MSDRPGQDIPVTIHANAWSAGCLPGLLGRQIVAVETQIRICGGDMTAEEKRNCSEYRDQLCAVQDAVVKAWRSQAGG